MTAAGSDAPRPPLGRRGPRPPRCPLGASALVRVAAAALAPPASRRGGQQGCRVGRHLLDPRRPLPCRGAPRRQPRSPPPPRGACKSPRPGDERKPSTPGETNVLSRNASDGNDARCRWRGGQAAAQGDRSGEPPRPRPPCGGRRRGGRVGRQGKGEDGDARGPHGRRGLPTARLRPQQNHKLGGRGVHGQSCGGPDGLGRRHGRREGRRRQRLPLRLGSVRPAEEQGVHRARLPFPPSRRHRRRPGGLGGPRLPNPAAPPVKDLGEGLATARPSHGGRDPRRDAPQRLSRAVEGSAG